MDVARFNRWMLAYAGVVEVSRQCAVAAFRVCPLLSLFFFSLPRFCVGHDGDLLSETNGGHVAQCFVVFRICLYYFSVFTF